MPGSLFWGSSTKLRAEIPHWASERPKVQCWKFELGSLSSLGSLVSFETGCVVYLPDLCKPEFRVQLANHTDATPGRISTVLFFTFIKIQNKYNNSFIEPTSKMVFFGCFSCCLMKLICGDMNIGHKSQQKKTHIFLIILHIQSNYLKDSRCLICC